MNIVINMLSNFVLASSGIILFMSSPKNIFVLKNIICNVATTYYVTDTITEIVIYKRLMYIPHHLCAIVGFNKIYYLNFDINDLRYLGLMFSLIEYTSLIVNLRTFMKRYKKLLLNHDIFFYSNYLVIRCIMLPYVIYYYIDNPILIYCSWLVYIMSVFWTFKWTKTIYMKICA
jgi:hypothetical protein